MVPLQPRIAAPPPHSTPGPSPAFDISWLVLNTLAPRVPPPTLPLPWPQAAALALRMMELLGLEESGSEQGDGED